MLSPYKCVYISYIPPPQLEHQYIDYTNGSSIVSGQKIHVDFDYGNGLDCRWLWKALLSIAGHHTLSVWLKKWSFYTDTFTTFIDQESTL